MKSVVIEVPHVLVWRPKKGMSHAVIKLDQATGVMEGLWRAEKLCILGQHLEIKVTAWPPIKLDSLSGTLHQETQKAGYWQATTNDDTVTVSLRADAPLTPIEKRILKDGSNV